MIEKFPIIEFEEEADSDDVEKNENQQEILKFDPNRLLEQLQNGVKDEVIPEINEVIDKAAVVEEKILSSGLSSEREKTLLDRLHKAVARVSRQILSITMVCSSLIGSKILLQTGLAYDSQSSVSITEVMNEEGPLFTHSDPRTNEILNYLAGKDTLSEGERLKLFVADFRDELLAESGISSEILDQMNFEQISDLLIDNLWSKSRGIDVSTPEGRESAHDQIKFGFNKVAPFFEYDSGRYQALWTIAKEVGSPKIRLMQDKIPYETSYKRRDCIAYYIIRDHTVVIDLFSHYKSPHDQLFAEFAHSEQLSQDPLGYIIKVDIDSFKTLGKTGMTMLRGDQEYPKKIGDIFHEATLDEYETPGTVEYEAHSVIEPELKKRFEQLLEEMVQAGQNLQVKDNSIANSKSNNDS